jgi:hypothetical protein
LAVGQFNWMKSNRRLSDQEWAELQLRVSICPHQPSWPTEHVHWQKLHAVPNEARERVSRAHASMDEIDSDPAFSPERKASERRRVHGQALAGFEASKTLARACQAVALAVSKDAQDREAMLKARKEVERGWQRAIDMIVERAAQTKAPGGARRGALIYPGG